MNQQDYYLPRTLKECRAARETAEAEILSILKDLQNYTGLDVAEVKIMMYVDATQNSEPQRRPTAVRIDLAV